MTELDATLRRQLIAGAKAVGMLATLIAYDFLAPTFTAAAQKIVDEYNAKEPTC